MENKSKYTIEEIRSILLDYSIISQNIINTKIKNNTDTGTAIMSNYDMFTYMFLEEQIRDMGDEELFEMIERIREKSSIVEKGTNEFIDVFFGTLKQIIKETKK